MSEQFVLPPPPSGRCPYAEQFYQWAETLCKQAEEQKSSLATKTAKLYLLEKYMDWRVAVPPLHRKRLTKKGHICIFQVFVDTYERLKLLELSLSPPALVPPPQPPPASESHQIAGIFLGETEG